MKKAKTLFALRKSCKELEQSNVTLRADNANFKIKQIELQNEIKRLFVDNSLMKDKLERFTAPPHNPSLELERKIEGQLLGVKALLERKIDDMGIDINRRTDSYISKLTTLVSTLADEVNKRNVNKKGKQENANNKRPNQTTPAHHR